MGPMADKSYRHIQPHSGVYPPPPRRLQNLENKRVAPNEVLQIFEFKDFMGKILSTQHLAGSKLEAVSSQPAAFRFPRLAPKTGREPGAPRIPISERASSARAIPRGEKLGPPRKQLPFISSRFRIRARLQSRHPGFIWSPALAAEGSPILEGVRSTRSVVGKAVIQF